MAATIASLAPVVLNSTTLAVQDISLDHGVVSELSHHSGNEYPTLVAVAGAGPRVTFRTPFRAAYDLLGMTALALTTLEIYLATFASYTRQSGANHVKIGLNTSCAAVAHITGLSINQDGILMADVEVVALSNNGTTAPLLRTGSVSLPSLASQPILHTLGPVSVNGTVYPGLNAAQVDLAPQLEVRRDDGALYPIVAARTQGQPTMTLTHADPVALTNLLGATGVAASSNIIAYFRQYNATTGVVSTSNDAISLTCASGRMEPQALTASQGAVATMGALVRGLSTSSTHPFAVSVSATAPALP